MPRRWRNAGWPGDRDECRRLRRTHPPRRRPVCGVGGPAVRRRRSWPEVAFVREGRGEPQHVRGGPGRGHSSSATPVSPGWAARPVRVRDPHHRRRSGLPAPRHRTRHDGTAPGPPAPTRWCTWRSVPTTRRRLRCIAASASSASDCASGTTGSAAPTPSPCGGTRYETILAIETSCDETGSASRACTRMAASPAGRQGGLQCR